MTTATRLPDEHAELLDQLTVRAEAVLAGTSAGQWPERELRALLGYLSAEVLRQAQDEEELLFAHRADPEFSRLARDHARLRAAIEFLERTGAGDPSPERLNSAVRDFLCQFTRHVTREDTAMARLAGPGGVPGVAAIGGHPHHWYALTEGPLLDLDALPPEEAPRAAADRVLRLERGESVELRAGSDPGAVWRLVNEVTPGGYGFAYLEEGPARWRVMVTRRALLGCGSRPWPRNPVRFRGDSVTVMSPGDRGLSQTLATGRDLPIDGARTPEEDPHGRRFGRARRPAVHVRHRPAVRAGQLHELRLG